MVESQCGSLMAPKTPEMMMTGEKVNTKVGAAASTVGIRAARAVAVAAQVKAPSTRATQRRDGSPATVRWVP